MWDINKEDQRNGRDLLDAAQVDVDGSAVAIRHEIANTVIDVRLTLLEGRLHFHLEIDRQESQKLLKLAFPLDIRAERAASEIQFGHLNRPIQRNTSWDTARFETVAHRWIRVGEPSYGVVIANDVVYEHDVRSTQAPSGRTMTITRLSLLRAPRYPDPTADNGRHTFTVSLRPADIPRAIEDGYAQSLPVRTLTGSPVTPLVSVTHPGIVVESIKLAEDRSGALVVRLYEAHGNRARGSVENSFMWDTVDTTDLLERSTDSEVIHSQRGGSGRLSVPPPLRTRHPLLRESARRGGTPPGRMTMTADAHTPRAEYPRPQFRRDRWINLNGTWSFEIDRSDSGRERGLVTKNLEGTITVPFAPEAELSGVGDLDFLYAVWYRTVLTVPVDWAGDRVLLHFGAVDHEATVWVDGVEVGRHRGGFASFTVDITDAVTPGLEAAMVVRARDEALGPQARGKQSRTYTPVGPDYWRTTGIWQTVWLEPVPQVALRRPRITPNLAGRSFDIDVPMTENLPEAASS